MLNLCRSVDQAHEKSWRHRKVRNGKLGVMVLPCRYGASLRKQVKKMEITQHARYTCTFCGKVTPMEITQHARYTCTFCGKDSVKRSAVGIWNCRACKKVIAGGAWTVSTTAAATVRSTIRRLREVTEA
ncbi:unnamed protein product [Rhizoctonia solani]|uniref:60S ribosomal protein L37a n=1 Tax=Rhizoctonia solani TaxID=456999 RepID=A0A8H3HH74_9AGAM|nr:unnamed protein product [Rhizoctonia solani]